MVSNHLFFPSFLSYKADFLWIAILYTQSISARLQPKNGCIPDARAFSSSGKDRPDPPSLRKLSTGHIQETQDRPPPKTQPKKKEQDADKGGGGAPPPHIKTASGGTGAWPREVGVQRVAWNSVNGLAAAALLASATAAGLCRVDEVWGRWIRGKVPYGGIEHIRRELEDEMDVDEEDEEGEDDEDDG